MARISLIDENAHPELAELIDKLRHGRLGKLLKIYRLLLHSPAIAANWFEFANAVRWTNELGGRLREMVIVRIALLNRVRYIVTQHVPRFTAPEGLTEKECEQLADWRVAETFSARERAALAYSDAMTRDVAVPDPVFEELKRHFNERQIVELTVLIAAYNMNSRVLQALQVEPESSST